MSYTKTKRENIENWGIEVNCDKCNSDVIYKIGEDTFFNNWILECGKCNNEFSIEVEEENI